jgi:two-component system response regulator TtrR
MQPAVPPRCQKEDHPIRGEVEDEVMAQAVGASTSGARKEAGEAVAVSRLEVAVVDDDDSIRFLVETLLEREGIPARGFASAEAFLDACVRKATGCIVLDLHLPGMNGLALQERLAAEGRRIPIIFFTARGTVPDAVSALKHGAVDFIEKPFDNRALIAKIRESLAEGCREQDRAKGPLADVGRLELLTQREREVMERVVSGRLNKSIADELGICIKTVEYHRARVMQKTGARSVAQLVQLALAAR